MCFQRLINPNVRWTARRLIAVHHYQPYNVILGPKWDWQRDVSLPNAAIYIIFKEKAVSERAANQGDQF